MPHDNSQSDPEEWHDHGPPMDDVEIQGDAHTDDDNNIADAEPPRRRHKYTTANLQPERPWKRWLLFALACLVIIAIMILISIFLQRLFDPDEDEDWSDDRNATQDDDLTGIAGELSGESSSLPRGADFISNICGDDKINGDDAEARQACEDACASADSCCHPYTTGNSTCFESEITGCVNYAPCHALEGFHDPSRLDLDRVCNLQAIAINPQDCAIACQAMECCYSDTDSCLATQFQACLDYAPCQNLRTNNDNQIPVAPASLDEECRDLDGNCVRTCRDAACCSDVNSACYRDNFVACLTYATCHQHPDSTTTQVTVSSIYTSVPKPTVNLQDVCGASKLNSTSANTKEECEKACTPAACCFQDGADGCFGDDPLGCVEYMFTCSSVLQ